MRTLLDANLLHGDCLTVTGATLAENLRDVRPYAEGQPYRAAAARPIKKDSHLWSCTEISRRKRRCENHRKEGLRFEGRARVFDSEEDSLEGILAAR